jgi:hypothetical protein
MMPTVRIEFLIGRNLFLGFAGKKNLSFRSLMQAINPAGEEVKREVAGVVSDLSLDSISRQIRL